MCVFLLSTGKSCGEEVSGTLHHRISYDNIFIGWLNVTHLHRLQRNGAHSRNCRKTFVSIVCPYSHSIFWDLSEWLIAISSWYYGCKHGFVVCIDHDPEKGETNQTKHWPKSNNTYLNYIFRRVHIHSPSHMTPHPMAWGLLRPLNADYLRLVENSMQIPCKFPEFLSHLLMLPKTSNTYMGVS